MTMTIEISPEAQAWLEQEAMKRGQSQEQVAQLALEAFSATQQHHDAEATLIADWQALSYSSLMELWDNEEDAVYDKL